jgi:N-acyl-D-aspartate/D-glutamate deacylase
MLDLKISGARLVDGTGSAPYVGDIGISGEKIVAVGQVDMPAARTIDATGMIVTPGFVDIHTHYDGQASWDPYLMPSSLHGVTSVAFGNCGVGFAPALPERREWLIDLLEGVEDIPGTALAEGLTWDWETFPEYLDALDRRHFAVDVGAHMPHAPLRVYVMGERGADPLAIPTASENSRMAALTVEAIKAGALGFSTSRTMVHKSKSGQTIGTFRAPHEELLTIARAMGDLGAGVIQLNSDAYLSGDETFAQSEFDLIEQMAAVSKRPISLTVQQVHHLPDRWRWMYSRIKALRKKGYDVRGQVGARGIGAIRGLRVSSHPLSGTQTWERLTSLPFEQRIAQLRNPATRAQVLAEAAQHVDSPFGSSEPYDRMYRMMDPMDYEPSADRSMAAEAARAGRDPADYVYDVLLENDGERLLYVAAINYAHGNLDDVHAMMSEDFALFGLSDGGAHCGFICDASFPTTTVGFWPRGNRAGRSIPLEAVVHGYTQRNARHVGWSDRGVLAPGYLADINVIDYDALALPPPDAVHDLPAGGMRLLQRARGYRWTIKRGQVTFEDGVPTNALPGRLVRLGNDGSALERALRYG